MRASPFLKRDPASEAVRVAAVKAGKPQPVRKAEAREDRDGLLWLIAKGRLKDGRARAGLAYRSLYRDAAAIAPAPMSSLTVRVDGGQVIALDPGGVSFEARRALARLRQGVLGGQDDLLTAMDGVCGGGLTLLALAGGDRHRSAELFQSLRIALDLIQNHRLTTGAETPDPKPTPKVARR